jgi:hypothetical protein
MSVLTLAGLARLVHTLRRDSRVTWHPGDPLPDVPDDAVIRHWHRAGAGLLPGEAKGRNPQESNLSMLELPRAAAGRAVR